LRAVSALIRASGHHDVERIYAHAERDGIDFNLAFIGPDFTARSDRPFDPRSMLGLSAYGYRQAQRGYPWAKRPPFRAVQTGPRGAPARPVACRWRVRPLRPVAGTPSA
jgi:hypothetical protein